MKTMAYWGQSGEPAVSGSWMAQHVTLLEAGESYAQAFKSAGGSMTMVYTDPHRVIPSRHEPLWDIPEAGWFHDASGNRVTHSVAGWGVQNFLNPGAPETQRAYRALVADIKASQPFYDFAFVDDTSWDVVNVFYGASAAGVEITSDAVYDAAENAMLSSLSMPVIINGLTNTDGVPDGGYSGTTTFLSNSNVAGGVANEGCLQSTAPTNERSWRNDENTMLYEIAHQKWAICQGQSTEAVDATAPRMYFLSSFWMTYDPTWSIAFPNFGNPGNLFVFPEYDIVPLSPTSTASTDVISLKTSTGAYMRRFGACYQAGASLGPCAAVVNPTASSVAVPDAARAYTKSLQIDRNNAFQGGTAAWTGAIPATLAPQTGIIIR